jgi:Predicted periplasmic solute-binding protein
MRGVDAFKVISNPANVVRNAVTLPEGLWASETFARLSSFSGIPVADYEAAAKDAAAIGLPAAAGGNVEGWLSPTTYEFPENSTATQQLAIMVKRTVDELARANVAPDQQQRILTLASIVEGEVNAGTDRGKVARVIENRLDNPTGPTVGFLQMDSTRNFAIQKRGQPVGGRCREVEGKPVRHRMRTRACRRDRSTARARRRSWRRPTRPRATGTTS